MVTFSDIVDDPDTSQNIIVWEIRTGKKKRSFQRGNAEDWPILKWNKDGEYFARMSDSLISVYQTPSFGLLDKKSIVVKEVKDLSWCPTENHFAYWVPETTDLPAKITVMEIPSRNILSTKSKMLVKECKLHWHKGGDYLCVKVDHYLTKSKKQLCYSFEIFHMREPQIPVDTLEMKEPILAFALEPTGSNFAIIHGEPPIRVSASFYKINDKGAAITKLKTLERREVNHIFWSPTGQFVVLAGMKGPMNGTLEFIDTGNIAMSNVVEHGGMTDVEWDPTGRYVTTAISYWSQKMDTGFIVWSFQGNVLYRNPVQMEKFSQLLWRPRPPSPLSKDDLQTIKKEMKKYQMVFEQEDRSIRSKASKELLEKRTKLMKEHSEYRKRREDLMRDRKRIFLEGIPPAEEEEGYEEQVSSVLVSETVESV
jgi:translation initiation factor 3 subunit B